MIKRNLIRLSALAMMMNVSIVKADSLYIDVRGTACSEITNEQLRSEIRYKAYDKAVLMAVKGCDLVKELAGNINDHAYNVLAYRIGDKALNDVTVITLQDDNEKICLEISGKLEKAKIEEIISKEKIPEFNESKVKEIAEKINTSLPKSIYETDSTIPLVYIKDMEYYTGQTSSKFTKKITERLGFEPRVLITENKDLADYYIIPKLILSKLEPISETNSRYCISIVIELRRNDGTLIDSERQNRYIIINSGQDTQEIAQKLIEKLLEEGLNSLSSKLNNLIKPDYLDNQKVQGPSLIK